MNADDGHGIPLYLLNLRTHLRHLLEVVAADSDGSVRLTEHQFRDLYVHAGIVDEHDADYDPGD